ncbi:hypothetical protein ACFY0G_39740 [Streptomyces sp. NPDC001552]|uniref:hypothetical protein n=1 Tax=Streptomyces sp. NPDC001552 TaxID=3364587 RepID=UPI00367E017A
MAPVVVMCAAVRARSLSASGGAGERPAAGPGPIDLASDLLSAGFAVQLTGGPTVDAWEAKLATYGTEYMSLGAADNQRRVSAELGTVQQQLDNPRLWSVAVRLMTLYAKTFPGSDGAKAVHRYRLAATAADASEDLDTRVWARGRAAIALDY